ncbi:hypothetical protein [Desulfitibacter alkalitolerans]|uniref:hypothetical protein n=1 Tax=Desulfitibacter alkalitolerans TaxID=264641 RepID=UPI000488ACC8|nr:hypothetical protein [Desulfitibacter alkalitolerans]
MIELPLLLVIFHGIPESAALVFVTLAVLKANFSWKNVLLLGALLAAAAFFVRLLPVAFGIHTVLLILMLSVIVLYFTKYDIIKVVTAVLIAAVLLLVFEFISFSFIMFLFDIRLEEIAGNTLLRIVMGAPSTLLLFLTGFTIQYFRGKNKNY